MEETFLYQNFDTEPLCPLIKTQWMLKNFVTFLRLSERLIKLGISWREIHMKSSRVQEKLKAMMQLVCATILMSFQDISNEVEVYCSLSKLNSEIEAFMDTLIVESGLVIVSKQ